MNTDFSNLQNIDWPAIMPLVIPVVILTSILMLVALIDWYKRKDIIENPYQWLAAILIMQTVGPIAYLMIGRRKIRHD